MDWNKVAETIVQDVQWDRRAAKGDVLQTFLARGYWESIPLDRSFDRLRKRVTSLPCLTCGKPIESDQSFVAVTEERSKHLECWESEEGSD